MTEPGSLSLKQRDPAPSPLPATLGLLACIWIPLFWSLPWWMPVLAALIVLTRLSRPWPGRRPPIVLRIALVAIGIGLVFWTFHSLNGAVAGSALLLLMAALKILESCSQRDLRVLILIGYFEIGADFFLSQSPILALYLAGLLVGLTAIWLWIEDPDHTRTAWPFRGRALRCLLQALPTALLLFLAVPRIPGPLWGLGAPAHRFLGLPRSLDPDALNRIVLSHQMVFRIRYESLPPPRSERYFRGPVFNRFTGTRWLPGRVTAIPPPQRTVLSGPAVRYRITLEPTGTHALYALDFPVDWSIAARLDAFFELRSPIPLHHLTTYTAISYPELRMQGLPASARLRDLALPEGIDPKARALAQRWRAENPTPRSIIQRALAYFHDQPFYYTLHPPKLSGPNAVDQFLFKTRRGFCQHYASAFAVLMRAAGIPTRVVTGFVGGHYDALGGFYVIRESDAHAWDEVWLHGAGWVRIDPTAAIAASRVSPGTLALFAGSVHLAGFTFPDAGIWEHLQNGWDVLNAVWDRWVLGYGPRLQRRLLNSLNPAKHHTLEWIGLILLALIIPTLATGGWLLWSHFRELRLSPEERVWLRLVRKLRDWGHPEAWETPLAFAERIGQKLPESQASLRLLALDYSELHYGDRVLPARIALLRVAVSRFTLPHSKNPPPRS
ncbi:MAG: transglutaminase TgpA family protein [Gammaproteobacteria bacterium]